MSHVSLFVLKQYVDSGDLLEAPDVTHVSQCERCGEALRRLATRSLEGRGLVPVLPIQDTRPVALAAFMAVAAVLAVLLTRPLQHAPTPRADVAVFAPEGVHGVTEQTPVFFSAAPLSDGGERLGSD